jgi:hypothetical protein
MLQTLYKTKNPMKSVDEGEFYELVLKQDQVGGKTVFKVTETHGWWDEAGRRAVHLVKTLSPEEGFSTLQEAQERYKEQLQERISNGFTHSFTPDFSPDNPNGYVYENLADVEA